MNLYTSDLPKTKTTTPALKLSGELCLQISRCYFGLSKHFRVKALSRATKIQLYQTLIQLVLLYGAEALCRKQMKHLLESSREKLSVKYMALQSTTANTDDG